MPPGFDGRDWSDTRRPRRHRSFTVPKQDWVGRQRIAHAYAMQPDVVDRAKRKLGDRLDRYCEANGYLIDPESVSWNTWISDGDGTTEVELRVQLVPRMDGVWGEIRSALAEDEQDRREATAARDSVHDDLDRLKAGQEWWRPRRFRNPR